MKLWNFASLKNRVCVASPASYLLLFWKTFAFHLQTTTPQWSFQIGRLSKLFCSLVLMEKIKDAFSVLAILVLRRSEFPPQQLTSPPHTHVGCSYVSTPSPVSGVFPSSCPSRCRNSKLRLEPVDSVWSHSFLDSPLQQTLKWHLILLAEINDAYAVYIETGKGECMFKCLRSFSYQFPIYQRSTCF